jgi:outer membrane beta-barrel protein
MTAQKNRLTLTLLMIAALAVPAFALAQNSTDDGEIPMETDSPVSESTEVDQIEAELERTAKPAVVEEVPIKEDVKLETVSDLKQLNPFSEISVIQRRFLPKTSRAQLFAGFSSIVNDPWFNSLGLTAKGAYHFTEAWGIELTYSILSPSDRQSVQDLRNENQVQTSSIISTRSYAGGAIIWSPIYGKVSLLNERIVPFDMYFGVGAGQTGLSAGTGGSTLHFSTGQIYAITKSTGFRWDFTWNSFSALPPSGNKQSFSNLVLNLGVSFFVPEAKYR